MGILMRALERLERGLELDDDEAEAVDDADAEDGGDNFWSRVTRWADGGGEPDDTGGGYCSAFDCHEDDLPS